PDARWPAGTSTQRASTVARLAVNCQEVVRGHQVTHVRSTVKRAVTTLPIVVVQPGGQRLGALSGAGIGAAVRPLAQQGLDKPLGLAVGARGIGPRTEVAHARAATEAPETRPDIAGAVVGQHPAHADAVAAKPG